MRYRLDIPIAPLSLNRLLNMHWARRQQHKRVLTEYALAGALAMGIPPASGKRRVYIQFVFPDHRVRDKDNFLKHIMDALRDSRMIVDDSPEYVDVVGVEFLYEPRCVTDDWSHISPRTTIFLEDDDDNGTHVR